LLRFSGSVIAWLIAGIASIVRPGGYNERDDVHGITRETVQKRFGRQLPALSVCSWQSNGVTVWSRAS